MVDDLVSVVLKRFESIQIPEEKAAKLKDEANEYFKSNFCQLIATCLFSEEIYDVAINLYTKAIELNSSDSIFYR